MPEEWGYLGGSKGLSVAPSARTVPATYSDPFSGDLDSLPDLEIVVPLGKNPG